MLSQVHVIKKTFQQIFSLLADKLIKKYDMHIRTIRVKLKIIFRIDFFVPYNLSNIYLDSLKKRSLKKPTVKKLQALY